MFARSQYEFFLGIGALYEYTKMTPVVYILYGNQIYWTLIIQNNY
jgi:hypothetical protein